MIKKNDIIQITKESHNWCGCLLQVKDVNPTSKNVLAYIKTPVEGNAYIRLNFGDFEKIGEAVMEEVEGGVKRFRTVLYVEKQ